jgi:PAS domain S-box-containing protein
MSDPERQSRAELRALGLEKLNRAEARYRGAFVQTQKVLADYDCMPPSDGNFALERALKLQNEATNEYAAMLKELMNLMVRPDDGTLTKPDAQKQHNPSTELGKPKALSPNEYQILLEQAPMLIWRANTSAECDYFNDRWLQFRGRRMDQECGNQWAEGVHPEDLQHCLATYREAFEKRQSFEMEYRLQRHDGEYRWILDRGAPFFGKNHEFLGYIGSCIDVTDRIEAQRALDRARDRELASLRGILPICMQCKKIQRADGGWVQLERYIRDHSHADFSHGLCPECYQDYCNQHRMGLENQNPKSEGQ